MTRTDGHWDTDLAGSRLTIDLGGLADNWRRLAAMAGGAETAAAIKGNAYGIGLEPAARALAKAGCRTFFVALPDEGLRARAAVPDAEIYVLNGLAGGSALALAAARLNPVLGSEEELAEWAETRPDGAAAALHVDTGMNRLGISLAEAAALARDKTRIERLGLDLVMSHLFCADRPDHPSNALQLRRFQEVHGLFPGLRASLANSAGIALGEDFRFDLVRPGIALYGGAFAIDTPPLATVVTAETRIVQVRDVPAGETVGYGGVETTKRPSRIAILSAGYADGYHRLAGSSDIRKGAEVFLHGSRAPLIGRVSMDLMAIDVTDIPMARRGDWVELFGQNIGVDEVAHIAGTIGYELLTGLGRRYATRYIEEL